jgi:putative tryptophan/tyrosine transport system substrate-binding protein
MRRRDFIRAGGATLIAIAAMPPLSGSARQSNNPSIGFLTARSRDQTVDSIAAFREGLRRADYVDIENLLIEFRWADGEYSRLPELAADLVQRRMSVIVTSGGNASAHAENRNYDNPDSLASH